jgi:formate hydrogenlyase transcriptional activator
MSDALARYQTLLEISESIAAHRQLSEFFGELSRSLERILSFAGIGISLYEPEKRSTQLYMLITGTPSEIPIGQTFKEEEAPTTVVLETQEPIYIPDLDREDRFPAVNGILRRHGIRSYCVLPLITARRRLGGLHIGSADPNAYAPEDIVLMKQVARQAAVALENVLNHEAAVVLQNELKRERDHLRLLLDVKDAVASELDTRELFAAISGCLRKVLNVDYASMTLLDPETGQLRRQSLDFPAGTGLLQPDALIPIEGNPAGDAFSRGVPVVARRSELDRASHPVADLLKEGLQALCSVPLISRRRALGTINVCSRDENAFTAAEVNLLAEVAAHFAVALDNALAYRHIEELNKKLAQENVYLADEIRSNYFFEEIIGTSRSLQDVLRQVEVVAPSNSTVLICGETGTGKEQIARAIHSLSARRQNTFVKLNCAAIPTGLMESEMFGHEKGAFTGAIAQRIGRFELAHRGTIFLDEIGDIPVELQPKLLRVLQEQELERLGSTRTIHVDVRVVAATNKDLRRMVNEGEFRADLYYRLNVFPINMPPLRDRAEDIPLLVRYFAQQVSRRMGKKIATIHSETMDELTRYAWPGNIRELQNLIERAVILSPGSVLNVPLHELKSSPATAGSVRLTLQEAERRHILSVLEETNWVIGGPSGAAARLGMKRSTLQFRMQKLQISRPK